MLIGLVLLSNQDFRLRPFLVVLSKGNLRAVRYCLFRCFQPCNRLCRDRLPYSVFVSAAAEAFTVGWDTGA